MSEPAPRKIFSNWLEAIEKGERIENIVKQALCNESLSREELRECFHSIAAVLGTELPEGR